jgi:hypothetical protein
LLQLLLCLLLCLCGDLNGSDEIREDSVDFLLIFIKTSGRLRLRRQRERRRRTYLRGRVAT